MRVRLWRSCSASDEHGPTTHSRGLKNKAEAGDLSWGLFWLGLLVSCISLVLYFGRMEFSWWSMVAGTLVQPAFTFVKVVRESVQDRARNNR